jgi:hypothetical protein
MAAPRRKKSANKPARKAKAGGRAKRKSGLLSSLAQYVKTKAATLVKRRKKRTKRKPKAPAPTPS